MANNTPKLPAWAATAYRIGAETRDMTEEQIVYGDHAPKWVFEDMIASEFYGIGREGGELPPYVTGWRYGSVPEGGRSHNYREGRPEKGVSLMQVDGYDKVKTLAELRGSFDTRPKVRVGGFLHTTEAGGDGEPLLLCCKQI